MSENEEILDLKCNHLEADTIMFSIYCNIGLTDKYHGIKLRHIYKLLYPNSYHIREDAGAHLHLKEKSINLVQ